VTAFGESLDSRVVTGAVLVLLGLVVVATASRRRPASALPGAELPCLGGNQVDGPGLTGVAD
jgi:hypothetical protein